VIDTAEGVADEDDGLVEVVDDLLGGGDVSFKGQGRLLDDGDVVPVGLEVVVDASPSGAVDETAVDQYDGGVA